MIFSDNSYYPLTANQSSRYSYSTSTLFQVFLEEIFQLIKRNQACTVVKIDMTRTRPTYNSLGSATRLYASSLNSLE